MCNIAISLVTRMVTVWQRWNYIVEFIFFEIKLE